MSDYTEKNSNLIPQIDIPCFAWNSQAEQGFLFFKAKSLSGSMVILLENQGTNPRIMHTLLPIWIKCAIIQMFGKNKNKNYIRKEVVIYADKINKNRRRRSE